MLMLGLEKKALHPISLICSHMYCMQRYVPNDNVKINLLFL